MPSNQQRRTSAKRKLERQLERRAQRARRKRIIAVSTTVVGVLVVVGGIYFVAVQDDGSTQEAAGAQDGPTGGPCQYAPAQEDQGGTDPGMPPDPSQTPDEGTVQASLRTSQGDLPLTMNRAQAPCTVQSMQHLIKQKFFDGTSCHRLVNSDTLKVLQCGDPSGTGRGGPGYTIPDEKPKDLKDAPRSNPQQQMSIYPRGTLAMANKSQPDTGGSQFFMVYGDSQLPPDFTVFGSVGEAGLETLDKIAKAGVEGGGQDGAPKKPVKINKARLLA